MSTLAVAMIVTDAKKIAAQAALAILTPDYTVGFSRACCAIDPGATHQTPPTHWYTHGAAVPTEYVDIWQSAVAAGDDEPLTGLIVFTALNAADAVAWAATNLTSEGLQFVPDDPNA